MLGNSDNGRNLMTGYGGNPQVRGGSFGGGRRGYYEEKLEKTMRDIENAFNDFEDALINVTQRQFVHEMARSWYCVEAKEFFNKEFKPSIDALNDKVCNFFEALYDSLNAAAHSYSRSFGFYWRNRLLKIKRLKINVEEIQEKGPDGFIGIDVIMSGSFSKSLLDKTLIKTEIALTKIETAVIDSGFVGEKLENTIKLGIKNLKTHVKTYLESLFKNVNKVVGDSAEKHKNDENAIVNTLSGVLGEFSALLAPMAPILNGMTQVNEKLTENFTTNPKNETNDLLSEFEDGYQLGDGTATLLKPAENMVDHIKSDLEDGFQVSDIDNIIAAPLTSLIETFNFGKK